MPRVVANQSERFQNDDIFQKLSRETEIKYVAYRDRPLEERQLRFQTECREGNTSIAFTSIGVNIDLMFPKQGDTLTVPPENVDFYREKDKVEDATMRETLRKANIKLEEFQDKLRGETSDVQNTHM